MNKADASRLLRQLESMRARYGGGAAAAKLALLRALQRRRLPSAAAVQHLHEVLCLLRAYPDDRDVLQQVETMLASFSVRSDLRRHRKRLADSGIAGTTIRYRFFWPMARWLARRWPEQLWLDWSENGRAAQVLEALPLLVPYSEGTGFEELDLEAREWLERMKGPRETDATFLVRRIEALRGDSFQREALHDRLDVSYRFTPAAGTPSRTAAKYSGVPIVYRESALDRSRPDLAAAARQPPRAVRLLTRRGGEHLVDMAREAMVTRSRDLDVFAFGDPNDVRLVDFGDGLQFACIGFVPERRLLLHSIYGFLTLKNGVPIGYVLASALFAHVEVAYNTFETYRGGEAARVFGKVLAMTHHLFGAESFSIDPYQLGYGNKEGLASGAWWFYYKLGFRPRDREVRRALRGELDAMRRDPSHRSSIATLKELSAEHVFFALPKARRAAASTGLLPLWNLSLGISAFLAERFGAERERGIQVCAREAARLLGLRARGGFSPPERQAWERWSPLVLALPGVSRWSAAQRRSLVQVVRAKGGRRESEFVRHFDAHRPLRRAVLQLARSAGEEL